MEPTSLMLAGGKSLADTVDKVADAKIRHALLVPAATEIGKLWGEDAKLWADRQRQKRGEKLAAQFSRGVAILGPERFRQASDQPEFGPWAEGASEADPEDTELSDLWQATLVAIATRDPMRGRLLALAKQMAPDELHYLIGDRRGDNAEEEYYQNKLYSYGLVGGFWDKFKLRYLSSRMVPLGQSQFKQSPIFRFLLLTYIFAIWIAIPIVPAFFLLKDQFKNSIPPLFFFKPPVCIQF